MKKEKKKSPKNEIKLRPSLKSFWASWLFFTIALFAALAPGAVINLAFEAIPGPSTTIFGTDSDAAEFWLLVIGAVIASAIFLRYIAYPLLANRYFVNDDHVVEVYGLIKKERKTTKLEYILTVNEDIGYIGRVLGFGDIVLFTAGSGGEDVRMSSVDNPLALSADIQERADKASETTSSGGYSKEDASRQQAQIDKLSQRVEDMAELNAQLREQVAVLSWRLNSMAPSPTTHPVTPEAQPHNHEAPPEPAVDSHTEYQEDHDKMFTAAEDDAEAPDDSVPVNHDDVDFDDFSDDLSEPEPQPATMTATHHRRSYKSPLQDDESDADDGATPGSARAKFDEDEAVGLMTRPTSTTTGEK